MSTTWEADIVVDHWATVVERAASTLDSEACLTELIDNALDAGATSIRIMVERGKSLRVRDNGAGIPDLRSLVHFGGHVSQKTTRSGFYGVGFKDAAIRLGGERSRVAVSTVRDDREYTGDIEWSKLRAGPRCLTVKEDVAPGKASFAEIAIRPLTLTFPHGERLAKLIADLGYTYWPAKKNLRAAITIEVSGVVHELPEWARPEFEETVEHEIVIGNKRARLFAGVVKQGQRNDRPGITYTHGCRVIKPSSSDGCGAWSKARVWGFVMLSEKGSWQRTKNKTDLVNAEDLYEEVERLLSPLFARAASQAHTLAFAGALEGLEARVGEALFGKPNAKARRLGGDGEGSVEPKGTGRRHRKAKSTQPGETFGGRRLSTVRLELVDGWSAGAPLGRWECNHKSACISLFKDHPAVARVTAPWNGDALFFLAMSIVAVCRTEKDSSQIAMVATHDVLTRLAEYTNGVAILDGRSLAVAEAAE